MDTFVQWIRRLASASPAFDETSLRHRTEHLMDGTHGLKRDRGATAAVASNPLSMNVFTAPGKAMVGERPRPFGEALGFDPITSTLIFGER
ncbi:MAG TPA: hypothetical protein VHX13_06115 [Acidobacteriaceae bacterium]|jgi:hypothetical protein|nr:hypothetical protein [Acidobacteriaceae bacterium]